MDRVQTGEPDGLVSTTAHDYDSDYNLHIIEIYKLYVQMADNISARRQSVNSFFLSANTALVAVVGYLNSLSGLSLISGAMVNFSGIFLCLIWSLLIRSYRDLNKVKFDLIHDVEELLPIKPYTAEWSALTGGKHRRRYVAFSHFETLVPWVFLILHLFAQILMFL